MSRFLVEIEQLTLFLQRIFVQFPCKIEREITRTRQKNTLTHGLINELKSTFNKEAEKRRIALLLRLQKSLS